MTELGAQISSGAALVGAGVAGLVAYSILAPRSQMFFPVISRGDDSDPARIALTFDDGPWPEGTIPIRRVSRDGRQALLQSQIGGCSHRDIASRAGISVGTVKSRISRARDTLERLLLEGDVKPRPATDPGAATRHDDPAADEAQGQER